MALYSLHSEPTPPLSYIFDREATVYSGVLGNSGFIGFYPPRAGDFGLTGLPAVSSLEALKHKVVMLLKVGCLQNTGDVIKSRYMDSRCSFSKSSARL